MATANNAQVIRTDFSNPELLTIRRNGLGGTPIYVVRQGSTGFGKGVTMRRMAIVAAALLGLGFIVQASASAGFCHPDDCSRPRCNPIHHSMDTLGLSYFRCHHGCPTNRNCLPYVYPNRAPRDFWMLR